MSKKRREKNLLADIKAKGSRRRKNQASQPTESGSLISAFHDIEAPEGFRPVPMAQALMEFAHPLTEHAESETLADINSVMQLATGLWNLTLPKAVTHASKEELIENIAVALDIDERDADQLCDELIERKHYLFPDDIQPPDPRLAFMRNTVEYQIEPFDETQFALSNEPLAPDADDLSMLDALRRLDASLEQGDAYDDWESLYFEVEKACCDRYFVWLTAKGAPEKQCREFPFCIETFLNFVYRYSGSSILRMSEFDLEEFFREHLPRKVVIQPNDYVFWPPAMRLFYRFLSEKGYGHNAERLIAMLSSIEPDFIAMLRKQL